MTIISKSKKIKILYIFIIFYKLSAQPLEGFTLFTPSPPSPFATTYTYLIDNNSTILNQWNHPARCASISYLMPDSTLFYPCLAPNSFFEVAAAGGRILKYTWEGEVLWDFTWSSMNFIQHHDIEPLPNGNILILSNERKTMQDAIDRGRIEINGEIWPDMIVEIQPNGINGGTVIWEWHFWDHLIQDSDSLKLNFGNVRNNPGKLDINVAEIQGVGPTGQYSGDWMHANSVHYNETLDQIIISCRRTNEFYIIDHSTTTEEAESNQGGNSGIGGEFLYRWGNPQNYGRGDSTDQITIAQHSVNWIPNGYPGEGNILIFNNGFTQLVSNHDMRSSIIEITPPLNNNQYFIDNDLAFGPETYEWFYNGNDEFQFLSVIQGGAFRLPNGNTLVTSFGTPTIFEVSPEGEIEWSVNMANSGIARAQKFDLNYFITFPAEDINQDSLVNIEDILLLVTYITNGTPILSAGDLNDDGLINIIDILVLVQVIIN
jgi:hypothetical protein